MKQLRIADSHEKQAHSKITEFPIFDPWDLLGIWGLRFGISAARRCFENEDQKDGRTTAVKAKHPPAAVEVVA